MSRFRARFGFVVVVCALALGACGGDDDEQPTAAAPPAQEEVSQADREKQVVTAIGDYFAAARTADTKTICEFETEEFQQFKYNGVGQACLDNSANQTEQFYAKKIKIVTLTVDGDYASASVLTTSTALAETTLGLQLVDGEWKISKLA